MEKFIDRTLDKIFGGVGLQLNIIVGIVLIVVGIIALVLSAKQPSKGKKIAGWVSIGLGFLGLLSGAAQLFVR